MKPSRDILNLEIKISQVGCVKGTGPGKYIKPGRPGGVSGCPRAWYRSVSWVRISPSAYSYKFVGTFSCAQLDLRKTRERELATLDEKPTSKPTSSGIAGPYAR